MIEVYTQVNNQIYFAVAIEGDEVVASTFSSDQNKALQNILDNLDFNVPFQVFQKSTIKANAILQTIIDIYDSKDISNYPALALEKLPDYSKKVIKATLAIPVGYVTSYGAIAKAVGGGARAVGNAMACNRFAPLVPCHRVVKSDLSLGGYGAGGLKIKLEFLKRERRGYKEPKGVQFDGFCLQVFPVEDVLVKYRTSITQTIKAA